MDNTNGLKKFNWVFYVLLIVLPFVGGLAFSNALDIRTIQSNRFTNENGLEVWKEIAETKGLIAVIDAHLSQHDKDIEELKLLIKDYRINKVSP